MQGKSKKKVVFLLPQPGPSNNNPGLPLTLLSTASLIDRKRFEVRVFAATPKYDYMERIKRNLDNALCFAVSCLTGYQIKSAIEAIREVKKIKPLLPVVWGGWHASILPEQTLKSKYADIVVIGQGERTMAELVERLASGKSLRGLRGAWFKEEGKIVKNPHRPFEDPNNFPGIAFDLVNVEDFVLERDGMRAISYVTSQGCPFDCGFCAEPLVYNRRWFGLSPTRVVSDMEYLAKKHAVQLFLIADDNFFVDRGRVKEICSEIIRRRLNIKWGRVNGRTGQLVNLGEDVWRLMKKSGCTDLLIGAESGLQEGLDLINKMTTVEETVKLVELARKHGIEIAPSLMVGLPYDSYKKAKTLEGKKRIAEAELNAILDMLDRAYPTKDYFEILLFVFTPYPGNPLFEKSLSLGFKAPARLEEWAHFDIVQQNLPWLPSSIYAVVQQLMEFVFPYACNRYMQRHSRHFKAVHWAFHHTASFRWKHRFFAFPIEHKALRLFRRARALLRSWQGG
jgi:radical SAM superfamily enzyme YgiQ (UPF0313 family)